jgi:hypothetical protein
MFDPRERRPQTPCRLCVRQNEPTAVLTPPTADRRRRQASPRNRASSSYARGTVSATVLWETAPTPPTRALVVVAAEAEVVGLEEAQAAAAGGRGAAAGIRIGRPTRRTRTSRLAPAWSVFHDLRAARTFVRVHLLTLLQSACRSRQRARGSASACSDALRIRTDHGQGQRKP